MKISLTIIIFSFLISLQTKADTLYLAGGCFWCTEKTFENAAGVYEVTSGYCNGDKENAYYAQVSTGKTNHYECVKIEYETNKTNLDFLFETFIKSINPMDDQGQFVDRGAQYRPAIFYQTEKQKISAENYLKKLDERKIYEMELKVPVLPLKAFFPAEKYHQDYYNKNPGRYKYYEKASGRQKFLKTYSERFNR